MLRGWVGFFSGIMSGILKPLKNSQNGRRMISNNAMTISAWRWVLLALRIGLLTDGDSEMHTVPVSTILVTLDANHSAVLQRVSAIISERMSSVQCTPVWARVGVCRRNAVRHRGLETWEAIGRLAEAGVGRVLVGLRLGPGGTPPVWTMEAVLEVLHEMFAP